MKLKKCIFILLALVIMMNLISPIKIYATDSQSLDVFSPAAILIDSKTGKILYEKNPNEKKYPASTTKVMTAILVLENSNLEDLAKVSSNAILSVPPGYANPIFQVEEEMAVEELLYALLVKSSNEAANVLAEHVAGSVNSFASMMNTKAIELGCKNTHFVNANGVADENHYSTAFDLSLIANYAMKNQTFRKMVSTVSHTLPSTNKYSRMDRILINTNDLINSKTKHYYEYAIGIKTGYTKEAGNCLIAGSNKDGVELIAVVLGAEKSTGRISQRDQDCKRLFNYVYDNYSKKRLVEKDSVVKNIQVKNGKKETKNLDLLAKEEISILLPNDNSQNLEEPSIFLNEKIQAPIAKGMIIGSVKYVIEGTEYKTDIIASHDVEKSDSSIIIFRIVLVMLVLVLLYSLYRRGKQKKKIRKKKSKIK